MREFLLVALITFLLYGGVFVLAQARLAWGKGLIGDPLFSLAIGICCLGVALGCYLFWKAKD